MALKYTILKVILRISSKKYKSDRGFTLIELIVGLSIMLFVSGLAMNALVEANAGFSKEKRNIESSQNMSVILEMIGNDIKQAGENISDSNFPTVEFKTNTDSGSMPNSSKIIVRRALTSPLTLCEPSFDPTTATSIIVADNLAATVNATEGRNCDVGTSSSPLSVYRVATTVTDPAPPTTVPVTLPPTITTYYPQAAGSFNPYPTTPAPLALKLPLALRKVRDYRCNTDPNTIYDSAANAGADFCASVPNAKLRIAVSNSNGKLLIFNQTGEVASATADTTVKLDTDTTSTKRYQITLGNSAAVPPIPVVPTDAVANNAINSVSTVTYPIGSPIYVIEERVYTLTDKYELQLSIDGNAPQTLIKKIENFRVSARTYTNAKDQIVKPIPTANVCNNQVPFADQPTSPDLNNPKYICKFNYNAVMDTAMEWKTLAGIKVELQAKYDSNGGASETSTNPGDMAQVAKAKEKLSAKAEFFPRNVLSK